MDRSVASTDARDDSRVLPLELERRYPVVVRGQGAWVEDSTGKRYLDAMSGGSMAATLGHGRRDIIGAAAAQAARDCSPGPARPCRPPIPSPPAPGASTGQARPLGRPSPASWTRSAPRTCPPTSASPSAPPPCPPPRPPKSSGEALPSAATAT